MQSIASNWYLGLYRMDTYSDGVNIENAVSIDLKVEGCEISGPTRIHHDLPILRKSRNLVFLSNENLTLLSRRIINSLLYIIQESREAKDLYEVDFTYFRRLTGFNSRNISLLKRHFRILQESPFVTIGEDSGRSNDSLKPLIFFSDITIANGKLTFKPTPLLKATYCKDDDNIALSLGLLNRLSSQYAYVAYELLHANVNRNEFFAINTLRDIFGANSTSYNQYKVFHNTILRPAIDQLEDLLGTRAEIKTRKSGKSISHVCLTLGSMQEPLPNVAGSVEEGKNLTTKSALLLILKRELHLSDHQVELIMSETSLEGLIDKTEQVLLMAKALVDKNRLFTKNGI
jgi:hypothetical protein